MLVQCSNGHTLYVKNCSQCLSDIEMASILNAINDRVEQQDIAHPAGYPYTRDGMRLGIAALFDEAEEVWQEWNDHKRTGDFSAMTSELYDVAAVVVRMLRTIVNEAG